MANPYLEKLRSISFGIVPGASKHQASTSMYDAKDEVLQMFPGREEVMDARADFNRGWPDLEE